MHRTRVLVSLVLALGAAMNFIIGGRPKESLPFSAASLVLLALLPVRKP